MSKRARSISVIGWTFIAIGVIGLAALVLHGLMFAVALYFLFRPAAAAYFRPVLPT